MIGLEHYLTVAAALFVIGMFANRNSLTPVLVSCPLFLGALGSASPVAAYEPAAPCRMLLDEDRLITWDNPTARPTADIYPMPEANEFVSFWWTDLADLVHVGLQHCPSGEALLVSIPDSVESDVRKTFDNAMTDKKSHTMQDLAADLGRLGASTRMMDQGIGDCACNPAW
jgi:hypothetical protein